MSPHITWMRRYALLVALVVASIAVAAARKESSRGDTGDGVTGNRFASVASGAMAGVTSFVVILKKNPVLRVRVLSFIAVAVMCVWYVGVRGTEWVKLAFASAEANEERAAFLREIASFRRREHESGRDGERSAAKARLKLAESLMERRRANGYSLALKKLRGLVAVEELHEDQIVSSGNREVDVNDVYERAIVAAGTNVTRAAEELRARAAWHKKNSVVDAMKSWVNVDAETRKRFLAVYQGAWYSVSSPLGVAVYIERLGGLDMNKVLDVVSEDDIVEQRMRLQGYLTKTLLPFMANREGVIARDKIIHVIDLKDASSKLVSKANLAMFKRLQEIDRNYPEFLYRTYLVNAPLGARIVWRTIAPLLPSRVRAKVRIMGEIKGKNMDKLAEIMGGVDKVPHFLGGRCMRRLDECPPWRLPDMNDTTFQPWEAEVKSVTTSPAKRSWKDAMKSNKA
mmetsp:Transcript_8956/g.33200  ORF Transcript_8956/g.33200 Transcript_8956/m.33200 type:complete len:456 (-) Transcript_8956:1445-2812(-)